MVTDLQCSTAPSLTSMHNKTKPNYNKNNTIPEILGNRIIKNNCDTGTGHTKEYTHYKKLRWAVRLCTKIRLFQHTCFSLNRHHSSYILSKNKSSTPPHLLQATNQQICNAQTLISLLAPTMQFQSSCLQTAWHATPSCHFVEAFITSHFISPCICSMYRVLRGSGTYVPFICTSRQPASETGGQCGIGCNWFLDCKIICTGKSGDNELNLQVAWYVDYSVCSQYHTFYFKFDKSNRIQKQILIGHEVCAELK